MSVDSLIGYNFSQFTTEIFIENLVYKGLDDDEFEFLEKVAKRAQEADRNRWIAEAAEIKKFRISTVYVVISLFFQISIHVFML